MSPERVPTDASAGLALPSDPGADVRIDAIRRFNRFHTRFVGALDEGHLASEFSLVEVRLLYEIAQGSGLSAAELTRELRLDPGYLSRVLSSLERRGLVERTASASDGRKQELRLTENGAVVFGDLQQKTRASIKSQTAPLSDTDLDRLVQAMQTVESLLSGPSRAAEPSDVVIRAPRAGDVGWVLSHQAEVYDREWGWGAPFEALVAQVLADYTRTVDPALDRAWIAELDGERVGSIFLVRHPTREGVCKLRLLIVDPRARGRGLGRRLVRECLQFAREAGYRRITLWTNSVLDAARHIYIAEGFELVSEEEHTLFGPPLVGQTWERDL